ncbi:HAD-IIIC family phosphatase [Bryobacter aggregatus]|uniref:HAD-IIIC family phosphatase n=1 Tax=Bryobacter aggregatus TaxID=360054 RepID=UPI0004E0B3D0|nr:HAD-IIIC family phosphatase [Bryobacter aggregatus]
MASTSVPFCFAFASTFTAEPIEHTIEFWRGPLHSEFTTQFAPFGQVIQTLLDPASVFGTNTHGLNVLLFRWRDLGDARRREENANALRAAIEAKAGQLAAPLLVVPDEELPGWWHEMPGTYLLTPGRIQDWYPVEHRFSEEGEKLGGIPYTAEYFIALGSAVVRAAHAILHAPYKVLALDCDHTLWSGICGEDGAEGVFLTPGHHALQRFALQQREAGMLLALSSKNNLTDARDTFASHEEFPLRWSDITAHRIDWNPKPIGLRAIASELSLGLDSFIFLDDNPKEISEVDEQLPEVLSLALPERPEEFEGFLKHVWAFDRMRITAADTQRAASYEKVQEFGKALHEAHSLEDFYQTLELELDIRPVQGGEWPRAAQLTQRTNQFNFTTIRRSEGELQTLATSGSEIWGIHVRDRFGDYGFTGLLVGNQQGSEYRIENFLLSCRVLGRGVEHRVLAWLGARLGSDEVSIPFVPSAKNAPALQFLNSLGWKEFPARVSAEILRATAVDTRRPAETVAAPKAQAPAQHEVDYARIARELRTVPAILKQMRGHSSVQLATESETRLAAIWQDLLHAETVSEGSNFFDLGGHSLMVVLLLMRVKEEFGVTLGIDDVYAADVTLEKMARRIDELVCFGGVGSEEYANLLAEIRALTDEEAEAAYNEEYQRYADSVSR